MLVIKDSNINQIVINLSDYQFDNASNNEIATKRTGEKIRIEIFFLYEDLVERLKNSISKFGVDLPGIVKIFSYYLPLSEKQDDISQNFSIKFSNTTIKVDCAQCMIIRQIPKYLNFPEMTNEYISSKGKANQILNATVRSKIIFGVASIMKKLHYRASYGLNLRPEIVFLDDKLEPLIGDFGVSDLKFRHESRFLTMIGREHIEIPPENYGSVIYPKLILPSYDVYSFAFFLYQMFSTKIIFPDKYKRKYEHEKYLSKGGRPEKHENIPDHYWELIQSCWHHDQSKRPSFRKIVKILRDKKFALDEYGMKTDLEALSEYQKRIDGNGYDDQDDQNDYGNFDSDDLY